MLMQLRPEAKKQFPAEFLKWYEKNFKGKRKFIGHWTAGTYDMNFEDYHKVIYRAGGFFTVANNAPASKELYSHTHMRNRGATAICLACCFGAKTKNLGAFPPTLKQISMFILLLADLCCQFRSPVGNFLSHSEAADNEDVPPGDPQPYAPYGFNSTCERWDLEVFVKLADGKPVAVLPPLTQVTNHDQISYVRLPDYLREEALKRIMKLTEKYWRK